MQPTSRAESGANGRRERVARLFEQEGPRVRALARRLCGEGDADDLVQETFLNAYRALDQLQDPERPRPWLYAIAHRACTRMHRRRAGEPPRLEAYDELLPRPEETVPDLAALESGPHRDRLRGEAREIVERGLAELPESFRIPLLLADLAELRLSEIAAILGLEEGTVKTRVHRARLKLREVLARGLPQRPAEVSDESRDLCIDLLQARLSAFDQGVDFPYSKVAMCDRCRSVFATLDFNASVCSALAADEIPPALRERLLAAIGRQPDPSATTAGA
ncbi:MAG: RNA polymerase sigma factor [Thermoanaerobaculia bacterium]